MKTLIIVESPTKSRTIQKFVGSDYQVEACFGHVRDLPKNKMGIDVEHNFEPTYTIPVKAKETVSMLKKLAKDAPKIILATDEDREGEAISWHLVQALGLGDEAHIAKGKEDKRIQRIVFHEITKSAIEEAMQTPRDIDLNLVDAQQARRVLDRLVGYELSPFLWRKIRYGLSAGRVQSVAVRLVVEREREIQNFKSEEYWSIEAKLSKDSDKKIFTARLHQIGGKTIGKMGIKAETEAKEIVANLNGAKYQVQNIEQKEVLRNPSPPFTTSTLQQEAARKFGMSAKQTMVIAQQLYEGVELGEEGRQGLITYMRTDSLNLAETALQKIHQAIIDDFGKNYALEKPRVFTNKSKGAQEAHEAIRPTDVLRRPQDVKAFLDRGQLKLYDLIWKRTMACQMASAVMEQTAVDILAKKGEGSGKIIQNQPSTFNPAPYLFRANGQVVKFDGFIRAYTEGKDENGEDEIEGMLPELNVNEILKLHELLSLQHFTEPPARYTDASLIKALETHGVGRPSTYAPTLTTIQTRGYVEKIEKKYHPSEEGILVNDMLVENFPEIVDINFTSHIEEEFDDIAEGKIGWAKVTREFYEPFKKHLTEKEASVEKQIEISTTPCPHCGKMMIIKFGRMGKFLACPEEGSKITLPMPEEAAKIKELTEKTRDEKCPICGGPMGVKRGRFGFFLGCQNYPKCKGISKIWNKTGFKCVACEARRSLGEVGPDYVVGDVVERKSRGRGKPFYGCTRFPDCTFVMNIKPENQQQLDEAFQKWKENPPKPKKNYKKKIST
ncbi:MAG: type I DNA topoisomerase [Candidatus Doudnabacteria bacterium]|nr:type I DNA topoisomerase [Candidatus Doudnabacteria bacterium]